MLKVDRTAKTLRELSLENMRAAILAGQKRVRGCFELAPEQRAPHPKGADHGRAGFHHRSRVTRPEQPLDSRMQRRGAGLRGRIHGGGIGGH